MGRARRRAHPFALPSHDKQNHGTVVPRGRGVQAGSGGEAENGTAGVESNSGFFTSSARPRGVH